MECRASWTTNFEKTAQVTVSRSSEEPVLARTQEPVGSGNRSSCWMCGVSRQQEAGLLSSGCPGQEQDRNSGSVTSPQGCWLVPMQANSRWREFYARHLIHNQDG